MRWYYRKRAETLAQRGDTNGATLATKKADQIDKELEEMSK